MVRLLLAILVIGFSSWSANVAAVVKTKKISVHPATSSHEVAFISDDVPDIWTLVGGIRQGVEVIHLDPMQDGVLQMAEALAGRRDLDAIHVISHGAPGQIRLGATMVDKNGLQARTAELAAIGRALAGTGDILFYGCNIARGEGVAFLQKLAELTGADVAASTDPTGSSALGGNWALETATGPVETNALSVASYAGLLGTFNSSGSIVIPSVGVATPYPSTITVSGEGIFVSKVTVSLTYSHTFPDDIDMLLVSPMGQKVVIMSDVGGSTDVNNVAVTLDDAAASALPDSTQIVAGTFRPTNSGAIDTFPGPAPSGPYGSALSVFNGADPNGTWSLYVVDDLGGDTGSVSGWSLTFTTNTTPTVNVNAITGIAEVGQTLTGSYGYSDTESDAETTGAGGSSYQWYRDSQSSGATKSAIPGATGDTSGAPGNNAYIVQSADIGQYLFYCVTPRATTGASPGNEACSAGLGPVPVPVASTTTALASSNNPSIYRQGVTFTATVSGGATPTGSVTFKADGSPIAACGTNGVVALSNGVATCATSVLDVAGSPHAITADYGGDSGHSTSTGTLAGGQTVNKADQTITFTAPATGAVGGSAALSATASSGLTVSFGSQSASICTISGSTVNYAAAGTCTVRASQAGDANYNPAPDVDRNITVGGASSSVALASSINPSTFSQSITFTATVTGQNPTGAVDFRADGNPISGCASVVLGGSGNSKTAACSTAALSGGTHPIIAAYGGDANNQAGNDTLQQVVQNVFTGPSATGQGNITATFDGGGAGCGLTQASFVNASAALPTGYTFPYGLLRFTLGGACGGSAVTVQVTYPATLPAGAKYWKYGKTQDDPTAHWYQFPATIAGNTATFSLTDGGLGDDDLTTNGSITDDSGAGVPADIPTTDIPTLSEWAMLLLIGLLGLFGIRRLRQEA